MTRKNEKCSICERTVQKLKEIGHKKVEITTHQGIKKCTKCINEYMLELHDIQKNMEKQDSVETDLETPWDDQAHA